MIKSTSIVIISIIAGLLIYMFPKQALNPGELTKGHERLENACMKCHSVFLGTQGKKCVSCHKLADIGRVTTTGVRMEQNIARGKAAFHHLFQEDSCLSCHTDHAGKGADKTVRPFSHNMLPGKNINQCMTCHQRPADKLHENNKLECSQCHSGDRWRPAALDHTKYFRFDKEHKPDCAACHKTNNYKEYTCYGCHEHSPEKIQKEHLKAGIYSYKNCLLCHISGDKEEAKGILQSIKDGHTSGNVIAGKDYGQLTAYNKASHNLLNRQNMNNCISCHQSPFDRLHQNNNQECSQCHSRDRWRPATLDHAGYFRFDNEHKPDCATCHQNNNYREYTCYGCHEHSPAKIQQEHEKVKIYSYQSCTLCHLSGDKKETKGILESIKARHASGNNLSGSAYPQSDTHKQASYGAFKGRGISDCISCHRSPFDNLHQTGNQNCSQCHSTGRWRPATLDHAQYFRFDGNHRSECQSCHRGNNYKEYTCYGCHEHSPDKMEKKHRKEGISNYQDCAACHPSGNEEDIRHGYPAERSAVQTWTNRRGGEETGKEVYRDSGYNYYGRDAVRGNREHHDKEEDDDDD